MFAQKYNNLYNVVSYDTTELHDLKMLVSEGVNQRCLHGDCYSSHVISATDVCKGIKMLKKI